MTYNISKNYLIDIQRSVVSHGVGLSTINKEKSFWYLYKLSMKSKMKSVS